uniref:uncharacterized protein LOC122591566 n=1 Tax=Erigeron canadensis TaxID=72917 RepID=UPI001CB9852B|nr:uncharacterized protein LOC122591566 [Erigeron canadensis]
MGERFTGHHQFREMLTYFALANGFSLWFEKYTQKRCVARCGQRPPTLENPEEGKKRKQNRFGSLVNYKWIGKRFGDRIRDHPDIKLVTIADMSLEEHHGMLRSYGDELLRSNPGSTVKLAVTSDPDDKVYFDKIRVIALDGYFLKKPNQSELLSAIGRDGNNHIYPRAWAVVSIENKANWKWFLGLLSDDLDIGAGAGITLISDQHKGLSVYSLYEPVYVYVSVSQYLIAKNIRTWSRAFFELHRGCENVENGFSECFNYVIVMVRNKPIITMLEAIRTIVLERMNTLRRLAATWKTDICPSIIKILDWCKDQQRYWKPFHCGMDEWEVRQRNEGFKMARNVEDYVPNWFRKTMHIKTYEHYLHAVGGMTTWEESLGNKPLPPKPRVMLGRPKKKRIRAAHESHVT